jgi:polyhydroxybutyrate depolymerase
MAKRGAAAFVALLTSALLAASCTTSTSRSSATSTTVAGVKSTTTTTTSRSTTSPAASCSRPHEAGQFSQTFDFEGVARTYQLYVPGSYRGTTAVPLVFDFHGYRSNAVQQMVYGNFKPLADGNTFLIVAPDGQGKSRHFNLTNEKGLQNDIKMVLALLDHIEATFCVDKARLFSTGMSDGGAVTSVLACLASDRFAAFGAVAVEVYFKGCGGSRPVSIMAFHGTADRIVPFDGGKTAVAGATLGASPTTMASWAAHDHCDPDFVEKRIGSEVRRRTWSGCDGSSSVAFYIIDGGGHSWPGSIPIARFGMTTQQINASDTIWAFFAAHPLQG